VFHFNNRGEVLMSKMRLFGAVALSLALASASVQAATMVAQVGNFHGKVLVNQGEGFVPVSGPLSLKAGDTVMIGEESFATVSYGECSVALTSPTVFSVTKAAPCAEGATVASVDGVFIAPTADMNPAGCAGFMCGAPAGLLPLVLIGGAAATVGIVVVATHKKKSSCAIVAPATSC
jgi:hypothetical protein